MLSHLVAGVPALEVKLPMLFVAEFVMKKNRLFSIALLFLAASTAVAQDVRYNFDKDTDFSTLKTYKWVTIKDATKLDDLRDKQIKDAVEAELAKKRSCQYRGRHGRSLRRLSGGNWHRETIHFVQHGLGIWPRLVRGRLVRRWR